MKHFEWHRERLVDILEKADRETISDIVKTMVKMRAHVNPIFFLKTMIAVATIKEVGEKVFNSEEVYK